jgi:hypothetical protein
MNKPEPRPSLAKRVKMGLQEAIQHERGERTLRSLELLKLSSKERDRILESAASLAYEDYANDLELTAFEAFETDQS